MTTFPIVTLADGAVSDPQWFADITNAVNDHETRISSINSLGSMSDNETGVNNPAVTSGSDSTTSSTYVNMAGTGAVTSFSWTKVLSTSRLQVWMGGGWQNATNVSDMSFGVLVNGTDYDIDRQSLNTTASIGKFFGFAIVNGLTAGTYTIQARWKRRSGTGTPSRSNAEQFWMWAREIE